MGTDNKIAFLINLDKNRSFSGLDELFVQKPDFSLNLSGVDFEFLAWGDPISDDRFISGLHSSCNSDFVVNNLYGHYYFLLYNKTDRCMVIGNSLFSILPVYYCIQNEAVILSDNVFELGKYAGKSSVSTRFILEALLFNYPLFNSTLIEGTELLPSGSAMVARAGRFQVTKHTFIEKWFNHDPEPWNRCIEHMADTFLHMAGKYFPDDHYITALTGGFDGRALTAAGLFLHRNFSCYCMGTGSSSDLITARSVAERAGIPFLPILTDGNYVTRYSFEAGKSFIRGSSGIGTFSRAHYSYGASLLARDTRLIITGDFGSEIFRAVHRTGVMISPALYQVFTSENPKVAAARLRSSPVTRYLNKDLLLPEMKKLDDAIASLPCFDGRYSGLTLNQQFYIFVFEEIFRKYFGSEIVNQAAFLANRTPFLDKDFLAGLFRTGLAGIHSGFFEKNPMKRFKGQVLYAAIIKKAAPELGRLITNKGYRPDDLLSFMGKLKIIAGRQRTRVQTRVYSNDPLGVKAAWLQNRGFYESLEADGHVFDKKLVAMATGDDLTHEKARLFSLLYSMHLLKNS